MPIECLTIALTNRCPLSCAHCGPQSGPAEPPGLTRETIETALSAAVAHDCEMVNFTGGEPFATGDLLRTSVATASTLGLRTRVTTGGYWSKSTDAAVKRLRPIAEAGLEQLCVSLSDGHAGQLPVAFAAHAVRAARTLGVAPLLALGTTKQGSINRRTVRKIFEEAGLGLPETFETPLIPFGRAGAWLTDDRIDLHPVDDLQYRCPSIGRRPMLHANGIVTACSVIFGMECSSLQFGSVHASAPAEIFERLSRAPITCLIAALGPVAVRKIVEAEGGVDLPREFANICHMCGNVLSHPEARRVLKEMGLLEHVNLTPAQ